MKSVYWMGQTLLIKLKYTEREYKSVLHLIKIAIIL